MAIDLGDSIGEFSRELKRFIYTCRTTTEGLPRPEKRSADERSEEDSAHSAPRALTDIPPRLVRRRKRLSEASSKLVVALKVRGDDPKLVLQMMILVDALLEKWKTSVLDLDKEIEHLIDESARLQLHLKSAELEALPIDCWNLEEEGPPDAERVKAKKPGGRPRIDRDEDMKIRAKWDSFVNSSGRNRALVGEFLEHHDYTEKQVRLALERTRPGRNLT